MKQRSFSMAVAIGLIISGAATAAPAYAASESPPPDIATIVSSQELAPKDGFNRTLATYSDGTTAITGVAIPQATTGEIGPMHVGNCLVSNVSGGKKYSNCEVYMWTGTVSMSFEADYTIYNSGWDRINAVRYPEISVAIGVIVSNENLVTNRSVETGAATPATARYSATTTTTIGGGGTYWVQLNVGQNLAWESHSGG